MSTQTSKSSAHTPAPWHLYDGDADWLHVCDADQHWLADIGISNDGDVDPEESDANAHLIAAAPELLAALKTLSDSMCMAEEAEHLLECDDAKSCSLCIARAAIAKAEGRA